MRDTVATVDFSARTKFDDLCHRLAARQADGILDRPLGHWALVGDRRLPYALLDRPLQTIVHTPFADLSRTRGIGTKKLRSLLVLLERAVTDETALLEPAKLPQSPERSDQFQFESVCESHWELWRNTVRLHDLSAVPLGRLAPSLADIPSVIWHTPLSAYLDCKLATMREMKSHGDKRLRAVVEIYFHIHRVLGESARTRHLAASLRPAFAVAIEHWLADVMVRVNPATLQELRDNLVLPVLNQILLDGGDIVGQLAVGRLGIEATPESVIEQAERLNVTRARVYQLLDTCGDIMEVRWPEGRWQLAALANQFNQLESLDMRVLVMESLQPLLYPNRSLSLPASAAGPQPEVVDPSREPVLKNPF